MKIPVNFPLFLVDDDKLFITALSHQLKDVFKRENPVQTFLTGEEFLKKLPKEPSVVILDYHLNSSYKDAMNGLEVLKKIMAVNPETKVIFLSSQDKMEIAVDTIKHGAYDYIVKNDNVMLRTKLSIINAADAIAVSKELNSFKTIVKIVAALIIIIIAGSMLLQHYFPGFSGVPR
jgi:two-component system, OmpR family, response regulator